LSYVALATARFDEVIRFYTEALGLPTISSWDRPAGRGRVCELNGLRLEILDASREAAPLRLEPPGDRFHIVLEVEDIDAARRCLSVEASPTVTTNWGARSFQVRDPDGVSVWFLQWLSDAERGPR